MTEYGGNAIFIDRDDINTDEIIPAKYLTEISKQALKPHLLEELKLEEGFDNQSKEMQNAEVLITKSNFGCGSSREHAVWALEVNNFKLVIGESFARIFRQNMFNCGIMALELTKSDIEELFKIKGEVEISVDLKNEKITAKSNAKKQKAVQYNFKLNPFDKKLIQDGGWLAYAVKNY